MPTLNSVGGPTKDAVAAVRRLLDLGGERKTAVLHRSGSKDEGDLIQTHAIRTLTAPNDVLFVVGRKGTGKTRLVRAVAAGTAEPLLVADDFAESRGLRANWPELKVLAQRFSKSPIQFWWLILAAALTTENTDRDSLEDAISLLKKKRTETLISLCRNSASRGIPRTFLFDGLETAFEHLNTLPFIASLIQLVSSIDGDSKLSRLARIQVFVRTDLVKQGYENFEQLSQGRTLFLEWDAQAIMNFVLSRVAALPWFRTNFADVVSEIDSIGPQVRAGEVETEMAESLLLEIFPERLRRLNLKTTTYLRTYFSDDPEGKISFYPRIYSGFHDG
jgi:hypothetical protein